MVCKNKKTFKTNINSLTTFSFIIPFYKGETVFERLISSLNKASKNCSDVQIEIIIIVDSVESDLNNIEAIILPYKSNAVKFILKKNDINLGVAKTRNKGLDLATGTYVSFIDQDDFIDDVIYFKEVLKAIEYGGELIVLNGKFIFEKTVKPLLIYPFHPSINLKNIVLYDIIRSPGQVIIHRKLLEGIYFPIPHTNFGSDDKFFWVRIFLKFKELKPAYISQPLYFANINNDNFSNDYKQLYKSVLEIWENVDFKDLKNSLIARRNIAYCKYQLNVSQSRIEKLVGLWQFCCYYIQTNKLVTFMLKKIYAKK